MIRNTALLTLLVFTFTLFTPMLMQPKEAYAVDPCDVCKMVTETETSGTITMVFEVLKVSAACAYTCTVIKNWLFNKCTAEGTRGCDGKTKYNCDSTDHPVGCKVKNICSCVFDKKHGAIKCDNKSCRSYNKETHRQCGGSHTCFPKTSSSQSTSYSGAYW